FQAEDGIRDRNVTGVQTCALPILEVNQVTQEVVFRFVDNGRGIEDNLIPFIFDRYYKVKKLPEEYHGTGVGLAIVKEIIQAHGEIGRASCRERGEMWRREGTVEEE